MRLKHFMALMIFIALLLLSQMNTISDAWESTQISCEELIYEALYEQRDEIFLGAYGLTEDELTDVWYNVTHQNANLFYVGAQYEYYLYGNRVLSVTPTYTAYGSTLELAQSVYHDAMGEILVNHNPEWTPLQSALYFHDYMCMHYYYDEAKTHYTSYELLTERTGVCQAYAMVYAALLDAIGIDCTFVVSEEMNHVWNVVTIDGVQYNVDVTFDDPTSDRRGRVSHRNFLCSDAAFSENHQYTWLEGYGQCTDTRYDTGAVWEEVRTGFVPIGKDFYFIKNGDLYSWDGQTTQYIDTIYATWYTDQEDGSYWRGNHSALWVLGDQVLYSKPDRIMSYTPATGEFAVEYVSPYDEDIYGFTYIDDTLELQLGKDPNNLTHIETVPYTFSY